MSSIATSHQLVALWTSTLSLHPRHGKFTMLSNTLATERVKTWEHSDGRGVQFAADATPVRCIQLEERDM